ncbi:MAG: hypothetical protein JW870_13380, partial [Candidatus Delongbacteria bacterium]|nr:hypothetical protein [Candidatus Delongbacteria bacterium]
MSKCKYCGEKAGLFKDSHEECKQKFENGRRMIISQLESSVFGDSNLSKIKNEIHSTAANSYIDEIRPLVIKGLELAIENKISESPLFKEQEDQIDAYVQHFNLSQDELNENQGWRQAVQALMIGELVENKLPERVSIAGDLPILIQDDEKIIWLFQEVDYYKVQSKSRRVGDYSGWSGRILKGLYYRWGSFQSESVKSMEIEHIDTGFLALTQKQLYFYGNYKGFKLPYGRILAIEPYSDGVKIQKTHANAYPISFITNEGWFTYNLLINL